MCVCSRKAGVSDWAKRGFAHYGLWNSQNVSTSRNAHLLPLLRHSTLDTTCLSLLFKNFLSRFLFSIPPLFKTFQTVFPNRMFPLAVMHRGAGTLYELCCITMEFNKGFKI